MRMRPPATSNLIFLLILLLMVAACNGDGHGFNGSAPNGRRIRQIGRGEQLGGDKASLTGSYQAALGKFESRDPQKCRGVARHEGYANSCEFVRAHRSCRSVSKLLDYTAFFYCTCRDAAAAGYLALAAWIAVLFYLLASTASGYFCCSVEKMSGMLNLSPALAGASLVALGNGAPDVFGSIAAFVNGTGNVGASSVLGAALFVTTIVAGSVSICASAAMPGKIVRIEANFFVRDLAFFLVSLFAIFAIIIDEKVHLWEALLFLCIYILYAVVVAVVEFKQLGRRPKADSQAGDREPLLEPLIINIAADEQKRLGFSGYRILQALWKYGIEWPLELPRRMTIPVADEDRWSRFCAVCSAALGPVMAVFLLADGKFWRTIGVCSGATLGLIALLTTDSERPPRRFAIAWVAGGFLMSILWFYLVAGELVAELVSLGVIFNISPAVLGLTVLAWGNSVGDLVSNVSLANCKSSHGVRTAVSGCYAGPMFNTLVGLGLSMVLAAARCYPEPLAMPCDSAIIYTLGFLTAALVWALLLLPVRGMLLTKEFGIGLLLLYFLFLILRIVFLYR